MHYKEKCRCCLNAKGTMLSLYDKDESEVVAAGQMTIVDLLKMFTGMSIGRSDDLPDQICTGCLDSLLRIYTFKMNCDSSGDTLRQMEGCLASNENVSKICRTCVQTSQRMYPLDDFKHLLKYFMNDSLLENDGLPQKICNNCIDSLKVATEFKQKCESSQKELYKNLVDKITSCNINTRKKADSGLVLSEDEIRKQCENDTENGNEVIEIDDDSEDDGYDEDEANFDEEDEEMNDVERSNNYINVEDIVEAEINSDALGEMLGISKILNDKTIEKGENEEVIEIPDSDGGSETNYIHEEPECYLSEQSGDYRNYEPVIEHNSYQCPACFQVFHAQHFYYHFLANHITGRYCKLCKREFDGNERQHISYHRPLLYPCSECSLTFDEQLELARHLKNEHQRIPTYKCNGCGELFSKRVYKDMHEILHERGLLSIERPKDPTHGRQCPICLKTFKRRNYTLSHMMIHSDLKLFKCEICFREFPRKSSLRLHFIQIHTNIRPYKCPLCPLTFKRKDALVNHTKRFHGKFGPPRTYHPGQRPYICAICNKSYVTNDYLKSHMKTHTKERAHCCPQCPARFRTGSMLRKHAVIHSPERPFQCSFCSARFKLKGHLSSHLFFVHDRKSSENHVLIQ